MSYSSYSYEQVLETRQRAVSRHACPQCLAPEGIPCLSKKPGRFRKAVHGPRFDLAMDKTPRDHTVDRRRPQQFYSGTPSIATVQPR